MASRVWQSFLSLTVVAKGHDEGHNERQEPQDD